MREIKFRAWGCFGSSRKDKMVEDWQGSDFIEYVGFDGGEAFKVMQYTGLKDKKGKEIYEGDVVAGYHDGKNFISKVWFDDGCFVVQVEQGYIPPLGEVGYSGENEILGNIHENPELLK